MLHVSEPMKEYNKQRKTAIGDTNERTASGELNPLKAEKRQEENSAEQSGTDAVTASEVQVTV